MHIRLFPALLTVAIFFFAGIVAIIWMLQPPSFDAPPQQDRQISDVTIINPGAPPAPHQTIVIRGGIIAEIRDTVAEDGASMCSGCFVMPGLIDAHVHTPPSVAIGNQRLFALMYLAYGVTSIRDVGESDSGIGDWAARLNSGHIVGPRMYRCGPVIEGEPPSWPFATIVRTTDEGATVVNTLADDGVNCIKVYNELSADAFEGVEAAARARNLPLIGHVPHSVGLAAVKEFESQHLTGVPYLSLPRPPYGQDIRNEDVLAMSSNDIDNALDIAVANNISFTPTLANFQLRLIASDSNRFPPTDGARHLPTIWTAAWDILAGHPSTPEDIRLQQAAKAPMSEITRRAHERGIDILAGTDTLMPWVVPGEALHLELSALAAALGDEEAALASATAVNGRHIDEGEIGVLAVGAKADMLFLSEDPRSDLQRIRDWQYLIVDGRLYRRETIDAWLEQYDRHFRGPLYQLIMGSLGSLMTMPYRHSQATDA